jgi:hypothetical protein
MKRSLPTYLTRVLRSSRLSEPQLRIARLRHSTTWAALFVITISSIGEAKAINTKTDLYKLYAHEQVVNSKQYQCLVVLWDKESKWNPVARNAKSSAYGIPQLLKMKETDPYKQIDLGIKYIRYHRVYQGDMCKALATHRSKGHY